MSVAPALVTLGHFVRGDGFTMSFTLQNDWLGANFDQIKFTVRTAVPASSVVTDSGVLAQVTKTGGGITFAPGNDTAGSVAIASTVTTAWPTGTVHWDLQGEVNGDPKSPYTIGRGTFIVVGDITRG